MKIIIDRFEGEYAVVEIENNKVVNIPRVLVPADAAEGDCLFIEVDKTDKENIKDSVEKLMNDVWID